MKLAAALGLALLLAVANAYGGMYLFGVVLALALLLSGVGVLVASMRCQEPDYMGEVQSIDPYVYAITVDCE
jgi:hypothetical protein